MPTDSTDSSHSRLKSQLVGRVPDGRFDIEFDLEAFRLELSGG